MMSFEPSPRQALAIFSMVFGQSEAAREPDMRTLGLKPAERAQLVQHRLIELEKASRGQRASLSDRGWVWAAENLRAKLDQKSPAGKTLSGVLVLLDTFLRQQDTQLAEFAVLRVEQSSPKRSKTKGKASKASVSSKAGGQRKKPGRTKKAPNHLRVAADKAGKHKVATGTKKTANESSAKAKTKRRAAASSEHAKSTEASSAKRAVRQPAPYTQNLASDNDNAAGTTSSSVAARIRSAALEIASGATRTRVRLSELRSRLNDLPREQVDRELFRLAEQGGLVLYRIDDTNDLDEDDRRAALMVAGNPRHVIYLENKR